MRAAVLKQYKQFEFMDVAVPEPGEKQVLVQVAYAGICGSDMHIYRGEFHSRTKLPMIPGHEFAGTVVRTGEKVRNIKKGDRVAVDPLIWCGKCAACSIGHFPACTSLRLLGVDMDGGFAEYAVADEQMAYILENSISDKHAALVEILSVGFHACNRAGLSKDDTAVIWGAGRVGQSILQAARTRTENTIFMVDLVPSRLKIAADHFNNVIPIDTRNEDPLKVIHEKTGERGVDVAFEAVGHAVKVPERLHPVHGCVQSIRGAGTVCVLGLADDPAPVVMKDLIWREGRIIASRVSHGEFKETIRQMAGGKLQPDILISRVFPLEEVQKAFERVNDVKNEDLKILIKCSGDA